jgi:hypothetical protein
MSMNSYKFGKYSLRPAVEEDRELCAAWIAKDPAHAETTTPDFFIKQEPGVECYVLTENDEAVFFFKMTKAIRVDIQFAPTNSFEERDRNREALTEGMNWLAHALLLAGVRQILFDSCNPPLIRACEKRLGFVQSPHELVCNLNPFPNGGA